MGSGSGVEPPVAHAVEPPVAHAVDPLVVHVAEDGRVLVHVGTRFVEASLDDLDRTLERLAAAGGSVVLSRDDPGEEPGPVALEVAGLLAEHDVAFTMRDSAADDLDDAGL